MPEFSMLSPANVPFRVGTPPAQPKAGKPGHTCSAVGTRKVATSSICGILVWSSRVCCTLKRQESGRHCSHKCSERNAWVAPLVEATGAPGEGNVALGAIQHTEHGASRLHGQVYDEDIKSWRPVLLERVGASDSWRDQELTIELPLSKVTERLNQADLQKTLPSWPTSLRKSLETWPLKGPGTLIFDPHFFAQRSAALALLEAGPVLFPRAASAMGLPSTRALDEFGCIDAFAEKFQNNSSLRGLLCPEAKDFGQLLGRVPVSLGGAHFDVAAALQPSDLGGTVVHLQEKPLGFQCESASWTCGAVIRSVVTGSEAERAGCRIGDIVAKIGSLDVKEAPFDDIQEMLGGSGCITLTLDRPNLVDKIYLREVPAVDDVLSSLSGARLSLTDLVPTLGKHFGSKYLFFSEQTPMLFAGDAATASHLHIDRKPLVQFCHVLHGTKVFCVAPRNGQAPGPVVPWGSTAHEAVLSADDLPSGAADWLKRNDVSVAVANPGDVLMFRGHSTHAGCNGAAELCVAVFHGAQPVSYMAQGLFGPAYQALARTILSK